MRPRLPLLVLFALLAGGALRALASPIIIDGRFDDWTSTALVADDPQGDSAAMMDFGAVRAASDGRFLHLLVDVGNIVNIQRLDGLGLLLLDADGDEKTGHDLHGLAGVDVTIEFSPPDPLDPLKPGRGIGLQSSTYIRMADDPNSLPLTPYDVGFTFGPTYAARVFEMRIERGARLPNTPAFLQGASFTGKLVFLNDSGEVRDETATFTVPLAPISAAEGAAEQPRDPFERTEGASLRVMSWNIEFGGLIDRPGHYLPVLRAIHPDVILLQEMNHTQSGAQLKDFLDRELPNPSSGDGWSVLAGAGGGDLRSAIASRLPLASCPALHLLEYPDWADHHARVAAATLELDGRDVLLVSTHLKCCGSSGSPEDRTREAEVELIRAAVQKADKNSPFDSIILAGDFNLVGSRRPLLMLLEGLDADGSDLAVAEPMRLDGLSNATWSDRDQPFVPGRLDYLVYADSSLSLVRSFVACSRDLAPNWLAKHGIDSADSDAATDHLPLVADFAWVP